MFGTILISVITVLQLYVFWRMASVPVIKQNVSRKAYLAFFAVMWIVFYLGRTLGHDGVGESARILEFLGMIWMATLFLIFVPVFLVDIITLWGLIFGSYAAKLRGWALAVGLILSIIALFQGMRSPVIREYEISLAGLPKSLDGTVLVALSDMHLGSQLREDWLSDRIIQVNEQKPDIVVLLGDIFEGHGPLQDGLFREFSTLTAPLGVWAVTGNHEYHGQGNVQLFEKAGARLLHDEWVELQPGLILAGVDDLTSKYRRNDQSDSVIRVLQNRAPGANVFLSHTPWQYEEAATAGVGLMLSGHTHGGQIWPFDYLVQRAYPLIEGEYDINGMALIVSRGTGTWGPRMRLWHPGEILRIVLRAKPVKNSAK